jgi:CRISPR-associated protein Cas5d
MFCLEVSGDYASFNRPEMKVERLSYDLITPSAARAVFEAILWKPALRWQVQRIEVLNPVKWMNLRRNEVGHRISTRTVESTMSVGHGAIGLYADEDRQQRAGLFLRDVRYRLHARFEITDGAKEGDTASKFASMFQRRALSGQCVNQPYLGCREFSAAFRLVEDAAKEDPPIDWTDDLGYMLYDMDFGPPPYAEPRPLFFRARIERGALRVPPRHSDEVRG